jgi:hypothetical protein
MAFIGIVYLVFEDSFLTDLNNPAVKATHKSQRRLSRALMGIQVRKAL